MRRSCVMFMCRLRVQVVKGKMSSTCLWHACRALSAGLLLMLLGAAMAVIGYYADTLSVAQEVRGNATVSVKDEARGFHLNNLSYAGPIVMGFGGFIVVAACVMTFEARDSAAKVTPARPTVRTSMSSRNGADFLSVQSDAATSNQVLVMTGLLVRGPNLSLSTIYSFDTL
ncbi:hypothetical protein PYW08_013371 [Mythimna loreyi]|uniref:Uncharacterized protein n=1 Tax=Mythimna loreyi TaxID=667449 RepID=A0ACC2QFY9_9NEOP|nr:hypothetical protein PYW08_013371 [Mythimna loreyi]